MYWVWSEWISPKQWFLYKTVIMFNNVFIFGLIVFMWKRSGTRQRQYVFESVNLGFMQIASRGMSEKKIHVNRAEYNFILVFRQWRRKIELPSTPTCSSTPFSTLVHLTPPSNSPKIWWSKTFRTCLADGGLIRKTAPGPWWVKSCATMRRTYYVFSNIFHVKKYARFLNYFIKFL